MALASTQSVEGMRIHKIQCRFIKWAPFCATTVARLSVAVPETIQAMPRKPDPNRKLRLKLNLTIHPEIRAFADELSLKRRRSISQLFEDLVEDEWKRASAAQPVPQYAPTQQYYSAAPSFYAAPPAPPTR